MNMKRVEMESKSDRIASFVKKAMAAVATSIAMVALMGVPVLGSTLANQGGIIWVRAMCVR